MNADLLALWAWEYDAEFIAVLRAACRRHRVALECVDADGMAALPERLRSGALRAQVVLDRVWDWGEDYEAHVPTIAAHVPVRINDYDLVRAIWNKPSVHYLLMNHGLRVPHMLILPSYDSQPALAPRDLTPLLPRFSVKGAHSGGSGVLKPARVWDDVLTRRRDWHSDESILQSWVEPALLGKRRAWFRTFYACGSVFLNWQDDRTHIQQIVTPEEEHLYDLGVLRSMTAQIAGLCGLNIFSSEIALTANNHWVVVDYVNDPCDYRAKSMVTNGVPDSVVEAVAERIAVWSKKWARRPGAIG